MAFSILAAQMADRLVDLMVVWKRVLMVVWKRVLMADRLVDLMADHLVV